VDEIIDKDNDEENWADSGTQSGGRSPPHDANDNDDSESGEDTYVSEKRTLKGMGIQNGKGIGTSTEGGKGKEAWMISLALILSSYRKKGIRQPRGWRANRSR
jgi:hypothetical protein